jgi:hypothetical protein
MRNRERTRATVIAFLRGSMRNGCPQGSTSRPRKSLPEATSLSRSAWVITTARPLVTSGSFGSERSSPSRAIAR